MIFPDLYNHTRHRGTQREDVVLMYGRNGINAGALIYYGDLRSRYTTAVARLKI
ncbi:MAG: hypothetical protein F6J86_23725 [Symploca sp. SIO1B1]|nr:hypothetical protein [Symploca sp. SIO1B1]